jgi:hypothetical protein
MSSSSGTPFRIRAVPCGSPIKRFFKVRLPTRNSLKRRSLAVSVAVIDVSSPASAGHLFWGRRPLADRRPA